MANLIKNEKGAEDIHDTSISPRKGSPFQAYSYSYPHKTAYRDLEPPRNLAEVWAAENRQALFLYFHIPFCEMRCGFCNLYTVANPRDELVRDYLDALRRQARVMDEILGERAVARMAIGGGTPTILGARELEELFEIARSLGGEARSAPTSVEVSPATVERDKLKVLSELGVERISMGVQSFLVEETRALGRPQSPPTVIRAIDLIRSFNFPVLNLDLIYGAPGQTPANWLVSLERALEYRPEEIYLYPLYVRELTGLGRRDKKDGETDRRRELYELGRDFLLSRGYRPESMRLFRAAHAPEQNGPVYRCQQDGMVGLGAGARSYTKGLHYSTRYAVGRESLLELIRSFADREERSFYFADYGFELDREDRSRRYVIQSILSSEGLDLAEYKKRFGRSVLEDRPEIRVLLDEELLSFKAVRGQEVRDMDISDAHIDIDTVAPELQETRTLLLSQEGLALSDSIGPWFISRKVRERMESYRAR